MSTFNEARHRWGFVATSISLESVQIMLLQAMYLETHARHTDFWRSTVEASIVCEGLIKSLNIE